MKSSKAPASFLNMGTSSLLVIFLILSISIFATLSLSTAKSDYDFSDRLAQQKQAYYDACNQSELLLATLDSILAEEIQQSSSAQDYFDKTLSSLDNKDKGFAIEDQIDGGDLTLSWQIPFSDSKMLSVVVCIPYPTGMDTAHYYHILAWETIPIE